MRRGTCTALLGCHYCAKKTSSRVDGEVGHSHHGQILMGHAVYGRNIMEVVLQQGYHRIAGNLIKCMTVKGRSVTAEMQRF